MRIALLPASGDPYVLSLWLRSFERVWGREVDKLWVIVSPIEKPVMEYINNELRDAGADLVPVPNLGHPLSHGQAIAKLAEHCGDGHIMLIDEDCVFLQPGEVERHFALLERDECDIAAIPVGDATPSIVARSTQVFGLSAPPHFAPCPFFSNIAVLRQTDHEFGDRHWHTGDLIAPLNLVCEQDEFAPCFVWASIQMRTRSPRVSPIIRRDGPEQAESSFFRETPPWVHIGALAQGKDVMVDEEGLMIGFRDLSWRGSMTVMLDGTAPYWEKKLAVWMLCRQWFPIRDPHASYYNHVFDYAASNVLTQKRDLVDHRRVGALMSAYSVLLAPLLVDRAS